MSKSKGNAISPFELVEEYGVDAYRYYFLREFSFGYDGNCSRENMTGRYNADLANSLGNMVSRVLAMVERELGLGAQHRAAHRARLDGLGYGDDRALAAAIRAGELDDRGDELRAALAAAVADKLAVANPTYADLG